MINIKKIKKKILDESVIFFGEGFFGLICVSWDLFWLDLLGVNLYVELSSVLVGFVGFVFFFN